MNKDKDNNKEAEDLVIAAKFPPVTSTSGIVFAKRILKNKKPVDVVQGKFNGFLDHDFNEVLEEYLDNRIIIDINPYSDTANTSDKFRTDGMSEIEKLNKEYKTINSRCFPTPNNFLAFEYKIKHPNTTWIAEFSDPILVDLENKPRNKGKNFFYHNEEFIELINSKINEINNIYEDYAFDLVKDGDSVFFIAEYLAYLFADKIVFTNINQREAMLSLYPKDIRDLVMDKSDIQVHPTLGEEYYHIKETDYQIDDSYLNLGYFGTYLSKRNFEAIYYALSSLNDSLGDNIGHKAKFHLFLSNDDCEYLSRLVKDLNITDDIVLNEKVSLLEFLNLSTKLDVLIVNDSTTKGYFKANPFLPSKVSDYLGSGNDIWAICEEGSIMESLDEIKYKSYINDYKSTKEALYEMMDDKFNIKIEKLSIEEELLDENEFMKRRIDYLNQLVPKKDQSKINKEISKLKKENQKLKKENKKLIKKNGEILSSNSWKLTKALRDIKSCFKKI